MKNNEDANWDRIYEIIGLLFGLLLNDDDVLSCFNQRFASKEETCKHGQIKQNVTAYLLDINPALEITGIEYISEQKVLVHLLGADLIVNPEYIPK